MYEEAICRKLSCLSGLVIVKLKIQKEEGSSCAKT
jgi:hypothetical protein